MVEQGRHQTLSVAQYEKRKLKLNQLSFDVCCYGTYTVFCNVINVKSTWETAEHFVYVRFIE